MAIVYGLKKVSTGTPTTDGTFPLVANMSELCKTYRDSCEFTEDEPTESEEYSDQDDDPIWTGLTAGKKKVKFSIFDHSPALLVKLKGGAVVNGKWNSPAQTPEITLAFEFLLKSNQVLQFPKAKVFARFNHQYKKDGISLLEVTVTPIVPATGRPAVIFG